MSKSIIIEAIEAAIQALVVVKPVNKDLVTLLRVALEEVKGGG